MPTLRRASRSRSPCWASRTPRFKTRKPRRTPDENTFGSCDTFSPGTPISELCDEPPEGPRSHAAARRDPQFGVDRVRRSDQQSGAGAGRDDVEGASRSICIGRVAELRASLVSAQNRLAALVVRGPEAQAPDRYAIQIEEARRTKEQAERALAQRSAKFSAELCTSAQAFPISVGRCRHEVRSFRMCAIPTPSLRVAQPPAARRISPSSSDLKGSRSLFNSATPVRSTRWLSSGDPRYQPRQSNSIGPSPHQTHCECRAPHSAPRFGIRSIHISRTEQLCSWYRTTR